MTEKKAKAKEAAKSSSPSQPTINGGLQASANKARENKAARDKEAAEIAKKAADVEQERVNKKRKERDAKK